MPDRIENPTDHLPPPERGATDSRMQVTNDRSPITNRDSGGRGVVDASNPQPSAIIPSWAVGAIGNPIDWIFVSGNSGGQATGVPPSTASNPVAIYGNGDPFAIAADLFSKFFSASPSLSQPTQPVVVGDAGLQKSGGSSLLIIVIVGIVAIGGYYLYKRYKQ